MSIEETGLSGKYLVDLLLKTFHVHGTVNVSGAAAVTKLTRGVLQDVCDLAKEQMLIEARAYKQNETFEAAVRFARAEGIIPAPEPAHAIRAVIDEVERGEAGVILFGLCGHGRFDLAAYDAFLSGSLEDPEFSEADMEAALARLPEAPAIA
jgi:tryptophan synthase beta chain